jgi:hypothetical protein
MEEGNGSYKILTGKPTGNDLSEALGVDGRIMFRMDLTEVEVNTRNWVDSS